MYKPKSTKSEFLICVVVQQHKWFLALVPLYFLWCAHKQFWFAFTHREHCIFDCISISTHFSDRGCTTPVCHSDVANIRSCQNAHQVVVVRLLGCSISIETAGGGVEDSGLLTCFKLWATARWNLLRDTGFSFRPARNL